MKVRALVSFANADFSMHVDQVAEISDEDAKAFINDGLVVPAKRTKRTATVKAEETRDANSKDSE